MTTTSSPETVAAQAIPAERDWWVITGMAVSAASAAVASFSGLDGLAVQAGWPPRLAWLLPLTVDAHAMTSARVWLAATTRAPSARRFARANALAAICASIAGNATYHAIHTGLLTVAWPIVVLVGAVPAAVLGLTAHLHALRGLPARQPAPVAGPVPDPLTGPALPGDGSGAPPVPRPKRDAGPRSGAGTKRRPRYRTEDDLMTAARAADARYRQANDGRPITRDALRAALRISGPRATHVRRALAGEPEPAGARAEALGTADLVVSQP